MGREPGKTQKILILRHIFKQNPPILPWKIIYNNVNIVNFLKNATDCRLKLIIFHNIAILIIFGHKISSSEKQQGSDYL